MTDVTLPLADITPVTLTGEPATDKAFSCAGVTYRVRVLKVLEVSPAVASASGAAAPVLYGLDITVTRLDGAGAVMTDATGDPIVVANERWTIDQATFVPGFDPTAALMLRIRHLIWRGTNVGTAPTAIGDMLADWGGGVTEP